MKGYGESDKPQGGHHYQVPVLVEDVRQLILGLGNPDSTWDSCVNLLHSLSEKVLNACKYALASELV